MRLIEEERDVGDWGRHANAHHVARPLPHTSEDGGRRAGPRAMARPIPYITFTVGTEGSGRRRDLLLEIRYVPCKYSPYSRFLLVCVERSVVRI